MELCGTEGRLWIDRSRYEFHPIGRNAQATVVQAASDLDLDHVQNFLECVRTRQTPTAPMKLAFQAALVVQMANLSLKQGRRLKWNRALNKVEA